MTRLRVRGGKQIGRYLEPKFSALPYDPNSSFATFESEGGVLHSGATLEFGSYGSAELRWLKV